MDKGKKRVLYYDFLNILATVAVVYMHCNGLVHTYSDTWAWRQALIIEVLCYWAVPVFFMLSGATLILLQMDGKQCLVILLPPDTRMFIGFLFHYLKNFTFPGMDP